MASHRQPNPTVAAIVSVFPGAGQLYNGQRVKALLFLLGTLLTMGPAVLLITKGEEIGHALLKAHADAGFFVFAFVSVLVFIVLFILGLFIWASAAVDARTSARALCEGRDDDANRPWFFRL